MDGVDEVGLSMTQPAKTQEPSMEEILASIRRIIADDEAKPDAAAAPQPSAPRAQAAPEPVTRIQPLPVAPPAVVAPAKPVAAAKPAAPPPPAASNSQDDIDAMLAGLDAETAVEDVRAAAAASAEPDDVFDLTEQMAVSPPSPPEFRKIEPQNDVEFSEPAPRPVRNFEEQVRERVVEEVAAPAARPLMSQSTFAAVDSAFNTLAQTVLSNNARTLEDLVKEMLRPLLKTWLDDNLPSLVEKIVRAEIERVSRGR